VDCVAVKGKGMAVKLYEVIDAEKEDRRAAKEATRALLNEAMDAYFSRHFLKAYQILTEALKKDPIDPVLSLFLSRSKQYMEKPPADDWQGFEKLTNK